MIYQDTPNIDLRRNQPEVITSYCCKDIPALYAEIAMLKQQQEQYKQKLNQIEQLIFKLFD
jgi:hypothetical protein